MADMLAASMKQGREFAGIIHLKTDIVNAINAKRTLFLLSALGAFFDGLDH
jgi:hypothetical protein